jgi:hypothetical protein
MAIVAAASPLVQQVLSGASRDLRLLAARGLLPLPAEDLIPLQVQLAADPDPEVAGRAGAVLRATEPRLVVDYLGHAAGPEEMAFFARESDQPEVLEALLRRRDVPRNLLVELAPRLDPALQEILILRQDAIVEEPLILDALALNPGLEQHVRRRIGEYREHLLPQERRERPAAPVVEATDEEVAAALAEAAKLPEHGERDETTGLTEGQIRLLSVAVRIKLARGAPRSLRTILLRDSNPLVALSALNNNALSEEEVEQLARSRSVADEVLGEISRRREWMNKYPVVNALVGNPRTPVGLAIRLVPRLSVRDLRSLSHNRNVPDAVRFAAQRHYRVKTQ